MSLPRKLSCQRGYYQKISARSLSRSNFVSFCNFHSSLIDGRETGSLGNRCGCSILGAARVFSAIFTYCGSRRNIWRDKTPLGLSLVSQWKSNDNRSPNTETPEVAIPSEPVVNEVDNSNEKSYSIFPWRQKVGEQFGLLRPIWNLQMRYFFFLIRSNDGSMLVNESDVRQGAKVAFEAVTDSIFRHRLFRDSPHFVIPKDVSSGAETTKSDRVSETSETAEWDQSRIPNLPDILQHKLAEFFEYAITKHSKHDEFISSYALHSVQSAKVVNREIVVGAYRSMPSIDRIAEMIKYSFMGLGILVVPNESDPQISLRRLDWRYMTVRLWVEIECVGEFGLAHNTFC